MLLWIWLLSGWTVLWQVSDQLLDYPFPSTDFYEGEYLT